jgi:hypothetical protein
LWQKIAFFPCFWQRCQAKIAQKNQALGEDYMHGKSVQICAFVVAISTVLPSMAFGDPLAPGKPAGVRAAQMGDKEWLVAGSIGLVALAVLVANVGSGQHAAVANQPITVVAPTTT